MEPVEKAGTQLGYLMKKVDLMAPEDSVLKGLQGYYVPVPGSEKQIRMEVFNGGGSHITVKAPRTADAERGIQALRKRKRLETLGRRLKDAPSEELFRKIDEMFVKHIESRPWCWNRIGYQK